MYVNECGDFTSFDPIEGLLMSNGGWLSLDVEENYVFDTPDV
jgi:hypothetical protein